jgi:hypothetical protein
MVTFSRCRCGADIHSTRSGENMKSGMLLNRPIHLETYSTVLGLIIKQCLNVLALALVLADTVLQADKSTLKLFQEMVARLDNRSRSENHIGAAFFLDKAPPFPPLGNDNYWVTSIRPCHPAYLPSRHPTVQTELSSDLEVRQLERKSLTPFPRPFESSVQYHQRKAQNPPPAACSPPTHLETLPRQHSMAFASKRLGKELSKVQINLVATSRSA